MAKYTFSGHETFQCKSLWLKKGYDFVANGSDFNKEDAVVQLGVGKNMVASIRYWLKAFGVINAEGKPTDIGSFIFGENGCDPYLEDPNTLWLLHYLLVTEQVATLYNQTFLDFHKERKVFSKEHLAKFIKRRFENNVFGNTPFNDNTIKKDIDTLIKNYVSPENASFDEFSSTLQPLSIIHSIDASTYGFRNASIAPFHPAIFLYAIKSKFPNEKAIDYDHLLDIALIFCISQNAMLDIFQRLTELTPNISFSNAAGEQLFTINEEINWKDALNFYYKQR